MNKTITPEQMKDVAQLLRKTATERDGFKKEAEESTLRNRAEKIAFREVEIGLVDPFKTYDEFQEKVASLMSDDLDVVEKALERGYHTTRKDGELGKSVGGEKMDPLTQVILTGELSD